MKDFDAVVFDMDGVIFDSERAMLDCWRELAGKYGIEDMEIAYLACIGTNAAKTKETLQRIYGAGFPYDAYAKEASGMYHDRYDGGRLPMKSGVPELLGFLRQNGKKIALASSTRKQTVFGQLRAAGILGCFDEVVTGDMTAKSKPEPDIFLLACERITTAPNRAYAIEDSHNGIRAAYQGRLRPIMVPDLMPANEEMRALSEVILDSLHDVMTYLSGGT